MDTPLKNTTSTTDPDWDTTDPDWDTDYFDPSPLFVLLFFLIPIVWIIFCCFRVRRQRRIANDVQNHIRRSARETVVVTVPDGAPISPQYASYQQQYAQPAPVQPYHHQPPQPQYSQQVPYQQQSYQQQYSSHVSIPQQPYPPHQPVPGYGYQGQYQQHPYNPVHAMPSQQSVVPGSLPQQPTAPLPPSHYDPYTDNSHSSPAMPPYDPYSTQPQQPMIPHQTPRSDQSY